jgi:bifunctional non-homologous end joining protein LigD
VHIVAPLRRSAEWDEIRALAEEVADAIEAADPERYTTNMLKKKRVGKIFLDYLRNARGATSVAPYSTRAKPQATVSVPLAWDELPETKPDQYTIANLPARLAKLKRDPWAGFFDVRQTVTETMRKRLKK